VNQRRSSLVLQRRDVNIRDFLTLMGYLYWRQRHGASSERHAQPAHPLTLVLNKCIRMVQWKKPDQSSKPSNRPSFYPQGPWAP
jgi:hypothetical protein